MATLNLPKSELIARLEARKAVIEAEYADAEKSVAEELERREGAINDAEAHAQWYEGIAEGLRDGTYDLSDTGKLRATRRGDRIPPKPGSKGSSVHTMRGIRGSEPPFAYYDEDQLKQKVEVQWPAALKQEVEPIDTAIDLLKLATDEVVEVNSDNYSGLLNGAGSRNRYLY